jgi:uroporphyrinogen-III synthase
MCGALEARGARAIAFPTIEIERVTGAAVDAAITALERYDWIAFTSANAVASFWDSLTDAGRTAPPGSVKLAAVGAATRAALEERGGRAMAVPEKFRGAQIATALGSVEGRRILLPQSDVAREETGAALRAAGAEVDEVVVYRTVSARPTPEMLRVLEEGVDAVTFTSPSTVRGLVEGGGAAAERVLRASVIACIGPTTAEAVRSLGYAVLVEPAEHTTAALVDALEEYFTARPIAGGRR